MEESQVRVWGVEGWVTTGSEHTIVDGAKKPSGRYRRQVEFRVYISKLRSGVKRLEAWRKKSEEFARRERM